MLAYKTVYGFQKFGVQKKFVGVYLYVVYAICHTLPATAVKIRLYQRPKKIADFLEHLSVIVSLWLFYLLFWRNLVFISDNYQSHQHLIHKIK